MCGQHNNSEAWDLVVIYHPFRLIDFNGDSLAHLQETAHNAATVGRSKGTSIGHHTRTDQHVPCEICELLGKAAGCLRPACLLPTEPACFEKREDL